MITESGGVVVFASGKLAPHAQLIHNINTARNQVLTYFMYIDEYMYITNTVCVYLQDSNRGENYGADSLIFHTGEHIVVVYTPGKVGLFSQSNPKSVTLET